MIFQRRITVLKSIYISMFLLLAFFCFYKINNVDLQFWDEATNVRVIDESSKKTDWWNLRFDNAHFWEKPPLYYWTGIIINKSLSPNKTELVFLMRSLSAVFGYLTIFVVFYYLLRIKKNHRAAILSVLFFLSVPFLWFFSPSGTFATHHFRSADSDSIQIFFITIGTLLAIETNLTEKKLGKKAWRNIFMIVISGSLAFLLKGVFGFLPIVVLNIRLLNKRNLLIKVLLSELAIVSLFILPWHIYMYFKFGTEFIDVYFIYHQLNRAGSALEGHKQPFWFYIKYLLDPRNGGLLTWILLYLSTNLAQRKRIEFSPYLILSLLIISFFSIISTKISWYVLIAVPFLIIYLSQVYTKKYLIVSFILIIMILLNLAKLVSLSPSIQQYIAQNSDKTFSFESEYQLHRVFLYFKEDQSEIETDRKIIDCHEENNGNKITQNYCLVET